MTFYRTMTATRARLATWLGGGLLAGLAIVAVSRTALVRGDPLLAAIAPGAMVLAWVGVVTGLHARWRRTDRQGDGRAR